MDKEYPDRRLSKRTTEIFMSQATVLRAVLKLIENKEINVYAREEQIKTASGLMEEFITHFKLYEFRFKS